MTLQMIIGTRSFIVGKAKEFLSFGVKGGGTPLPFEYSAILNVNNFFQYYCKNMFKSKIKNSTRIDIFSSDCNDGMKIKTK